eukprot:COSAG03_NODE_232_length_10264_cov_2.708706_5_plen_119_part_00
MESSYSSTSYLIGWQQQLANNLGSQLATLAHKRAYEAVNAWAKREEVSAALDPVASSLIAMLSSEGLATVLIALRGHQDHHVAQWVRSKKSAKKLFVLEKATPSCVCIVLSLPLIFLK